MDTKKKKYRSFHEQPDGTVTVGDSEAKLTPEEFLKLQRLMPDVGWLGFCYPRPIDICNDAYTPFPEHAEFLKNYEKDPSKFLTFKKPNNNGNNNT